MTTHICNQTKAPWVSFGLTALLACSLSFLGCEGDDESVEDSDNGGANAGETAGEETPAGAATPAGEGQPAGEEISAGEETPAGEEAPAGEMTMAGTEVEPPFMCAQDVLQVQSSRITPTPNVMYLGVDDRFNFTNIFQVDFATVPGIGQSVSLEGATPQNCEVCVYVGAQCREEGCAEVYFASAGSLTVTEGGDSGGEMRFEVSGMTLTRLDRDNGELDSSNTTCLSDQEFSGVFPALEGDQISETFALQNCETGEFVNVREFGSEAQAIWYIATAGWCSACRQTLSYLFAEVFPTFTETTVRPMIVVSEDDSYRPATLAFCKRYGQRYADDASQFYLDASLTTTFANVWPYLGDDGSFGLPWEAVFEGGTGTYLYGDGGPGGETITDVIGSILGD